MKYNSLPCPVCGLAFKEDDDIVVCPKCGTPHHRDCWEKIGHCANDSKHSQGFVFKNPNANIEEIKKVEIKSTEEKTTPKEPPAVMKSLQSVSPEEAEELMKMSGYRPIDGEEKIGDIKVKDFGEYVDKNKQKYIPKFYAMDRQKRKISWNWAAFFFPIPWLFYRKMVGIGIILAIFSSIIPVVFANDIVEYSVDAYEVISKIPDTASNEEIEKYMLDVPEVPLSFSVSKYVSYAVMLFCGMFGNYLYFKKAREDITTLKSLNPDPNAYQFALSKKGSVSSWRCVLAIIVMYVILELSVSVAMRTGADISGLILKLIN